MAIDLKNVLRRTLTTTASGKQLTNGNTLKKVTSNTSAPTGTPRYNLQDYNTSTSGSTASGGSGAVSYSSTLKPYLNDMIAAYQQGADANKATAKMAYDNTMRDLKTSLDRAQASYDTGVANANQNYETTRGNLLTSLKRFQEENAKNVENQKRAYLTDQAALESARLEADRQTRINNAARGLGGSGLQQLAQLQNLINQGQDISNLAASNQSEMDNLRTQMAQAQEDYDTDLAAAEKARKNTVDNLLTVLNNAKADTTTGEADALATYYAALQGIDANLANQIADANYNFGQNSYSASRSGGSSSNDDVSVIVGGLSTIQDAFKEAAADIMGSKTKASSSQAKKLKDLYNTTAAEARAYQTNYGKDLAGNAVNTNISNLKTILKSYGVNVK